MATPISVRLPDEIRELVQRRAEAEHRSLNAQIIALLEAGLGLKRASALTGVIHPEARGVGLPVEGETVRGSAALGKKNYAPDFK